MILVHAYCHDDYYHWRQYYSNVKPKTKEKLFLSQTVICRGDNHCICKHGGPEFTYSFVSKERKWDKIKRSLRSMLYMLDIWLM